MVAFDSTLWFAARDMGSEIYVVLGLGQIQLRTTVM